MSGLDVCQRFGKSVKFPFPDQGGSAEGDVTLQSMHDLKTCSIVTVTVT